MDENQNYTLQNEYYELIASLLKYLRKDCDFASELIDQETHRFFAEKTLASAKVSAPKLQNKPPEAVKVKPVEKKSEPKKAEVVVEKEPTKKQEPETKPPMPAAPSLGPLFTLLPKPYQEKEPPHFGDMKQKLQKLAPQLQICDTILSDEEAREKAYGWKKTLPQVAFLSFCAPSSQEAIFVKNVADAVHTRLKRMKIYEPSQETLLEILFLAQEKLISTILVCFDSQLHARTYDFFSSIQSLIEQPEAKKEASILTLRGKLYETCLFDLALTESIQNNPQDKALLWKTLQKLLTP